MQLADDFDLGETLLEHERKGLIKLETVKEGETEIDTGLISHISLNSQSPIGLNSFNSFNSYPTEPDKEVFYGLAGDIIKAIEPHTEADPVALLSQLLVGFGNCIGRTPYFEVEADRHYSNLSICLVGETAKGRKGTSKNHIERLLVAVSPGWEDRMQSGLSSGEGLIWAVRDEINRTEPVREDREIKGYRDVIIDKGIEDKRLLVFEPEFASPLKVMNREGNILSATIRQAWDSGRLRIMTKNTPAKATDAHISIIGHITKEELIRYLTSTELGNGFANRFLWFCVKRSKCLPRGGKIQGVDFEPCLKRLRLAVDFSRKAGRIDFTEETWQVWEKVYPELSEGKLGLLGAVTSRGEAQTVRLAMLYALLDTSPDIRPEHLLAALALWDYSYQSARYIFGNTLGDPVADTILTALKHNPEGLNRTNISNLFGRNKSSEQLSQALGLLLKQGFIKKRENQTGGRIAEVWLTK